MSDIVIRAEGLGKKYLIGHQTERERYTALRDVLARNVRDYWRKAKALARGEPIMPGDEQEEIWALREVSFEIRQGEAVGIIGRNGAGKSTLLKILNRITEPSAGRVTIRGRVASLLEVGTGFHPELTGRENIFLNGAILGMTRHEIKRKFDEIVDFAEVEKFLDTPVKRYSSGMYVRLAFAVAAHLEPEILVVDEVLAVGDAAFQKKCLGKMGEVARGGRTVLFVSHSMGSINQLCSMAIWLKNGFIKCINQPQIIINAYLSSTHSKEAHREFPIVQSKKAQIVLVQMLDSHGQEICDFGCGDEPTVRIIFRLTERIKNCHIACIVSSSEGLHILSTADTDMDPSLLLERLPGEYKVQVKLPTKQFNIGTYHLAIGLGIPGIESFDRQEALSFTIHDTGDFVTSKEGSRRSGLLIAQTHWTYLY